MTIKVLGSSSKGNCYLLDSGSEVLVIEAGVKFTAVKKALGYDLRKVVGCLVSHQHTDHAKYIKDIVESGISTLALKDVWEAKGIRDTKAIELSFCALYQFGGFKVRAFPAFHDVPCAGYYIEHPECGRILFLTDSTHCENIFPGMTHVMIECNYSVKYLLGAMDNRKTDRAQAHRVLESHMSLDGCKSFLLSQDLSKVETIILLHLSDSHSNEKEFIEEIGAATGKYVCAANARMEIAL